MNYGWDVYPAHMQEQDFCIIFSRIYQRHRIEPFCVWKDLVVERYTKGKKRGIIVKKFGKVKIKIRGRTPIVRIKCPDLFFAFAAGLALG